MKLSLSGVHVAFAFSLTHGTRTTDRGLNLPPTQGTTRDGAFFPGLYQYAYHPDQVRRATSRAGFSSLRLAVNVETANDARSLQKLKSYIDAVGGRGIICMFDTSLKLGTSLPRTGRVTGKVNEFAKAWRSVHKVFGSYGGHVLYELFNEPWGYHWNASEYVNDMTSVIQMAELPADRVILDGLYGAADVQSVARAGWSGYLAYHFYSFWLPAGHRTQKGFSQTLQKALAGLGSRVFITEFGAGLDGVAVDIDQEEVRRDVARHSSFETSTSDWQNEYPGKTLQDICDKHPSNEWCRSRITYPTVASLAQDPNYGADVAAQVGGRKRAHETSKPGKHQNETLAFLRGLRDGLYELRKQGESVRGLYHWHGWHNGDTWDFWDAKNARSSQMIQQIMAELSEGSTADGTLNDADPFFSHDYVHDHQQVHMMRVLDLERNKSGDCPVECSAPTCQPGNHLELGGKHLTDNVCTHNCSIPYNGIRYCGAGTSYHGEGAIQCGACAHPAMCAGLPCWSAETELVQTFLRKKTLAFTG
eukprot:gnl/MRDRNA2_/MRDRNA2_28254_c0_seq1.p1 gnl/MRDRNA2_/MRDRNA2_28254_c0~~gnl/MRDRNA2_/MRDRNA2_28254_c0_seq1.p1  ORF type:complete len:532 (+),score=75.56 gnl/MRDRNA2_/MRDRNA2_28254_c0_seq1:64-1659(+)